MESNLALLASKRSERRISAKGDELPTNRMLIWRQKDMRIKKPSFDGDKCQRKYNPKVPEISKQNSDIALKKPEIAVTPLKFTLHEILRPKNIATYQINYSKDGSIEIDRKPPNLKYIPDVNTNLRYEPAIITTGSEPNSVDYNKPPYAFCYALPLYLARLKGCDITKIKFLVGSSVLPSLYERQTRDDAPILVQYRNGILILRVLHLESHSSSSIGCQFRKFITETEPFSNTSVDDDTATFNINEISIGKFRVLVNAGVHANDGEFLTEINTNNFMLKKVLYPDHMEEPYPIIQAKRTCIKMLETSAEYLIQPERSYPNGPDSNWRQMKVNENNISCKVTKVHKYDLEEVIEKANDLSIQFGKKETMNDVFRRIHESLQKLMQHVESGTIREDSTCFYKLTFQNTAAKDVGMVIEKINNKEISDTVEYCSQKLYDTACNRIYSDQFLNEMKEMNRRNFKCNFSWRNKYNKEKRDLIKSPRLKLLPRTVKSSLNEMAQTSSRESIFGKAKPVNTSGSSQ